MLTFLQGTKLIIDDGSNRHELLIGAGSATQTFLETSHEIKTIHSGEKVVKTTTNEHGTVNLSFECSLSTDSVLFEWFGFDIVNGKHVINTDNIPLRKYNIYIQSTGTTYEIKDCIGQNISFTLGKANILGVQVTAVAPNLTTIASIPATGSLIKQTAPYHGSVTIPGFSNIAAVTCELTRNIGWLAQKSIFDIGSIHRTKNAVIKSMSISGSITQNKINDINTSNSESVPILIQYGDSFEINLATCNSANRWDMSAIHKIVTDYKLQPSSGNQSYIKF